MQLAEGVDKSASTKNHLYLSVHIVEFCDSWPLYLAQKP